MPGTGEDVSGAGGGCAEMGRNTKQPESWNLGKSRKRESARVTGRGDVPGLSDPRVAVSMYNRSAPSSTVRRAGSVTPALQLVSWG